MSLKSKVEFNPLERGSDKLQIIGNDFEAYLVAIIHDWSKTLTLLAITLVPTFFILDFFTMPKSLLPRFGVYRMISTVIVILQFLLIRRTRPSRLSYIHGYLLTLNVGCIIALMTVDLGGFNSSYYAGLNLVITGVSLLLPWKGVHSAMNSIIIIVMYVFINLIAFNPFDLKILTNNLFFMSATALICVSITHVKYKQVRQEFFLLVELKKARDAIWSEMELAKRIQTALLPEKNVIKGFEVAAIMHAAQEVGGDYYDIIETDRGDSWITIGDVSGHGVDSGLIMMMAQTSIMSVVKDCPTCSPSDVLASVNKVIRENISRLGSDHYMTLTALCLNGSLMSFAGKHQDIIIYRAGHNRTETFPTTGTWLGMADDIEGYIKDTTVKLEQGDIVLLYTDGITEAMNEQGDLFGEDRLAQSLDKYAHLPMGKLIEMVMRDLDYFKREQYDDMTIVAIKKIS